MMHTDLRSLQRQARSLASAAVACLGVCTVSATPHTGAVAVAATRQPGDELLGEWWTEGKEGRIRFARHRDGTFFGTTTCCKPEPDIHNPDPKLRSRSTVGIVLIWALEYRKDGEYENGYVYNPRDGETYRLDAKLRGERSLQIRGYLGIPLLGQSQVWTRAGTSP